MVGFSEMSKTEKKLYKKAWYEKNKAAVQLARITKGLENNNRKVRASTLKKYNIKYDEEKNEIQIPKKYKPLSLKYNDVKVEPPPAVINVVVGTENAPIEQYDFENNLFNGKQYKDWVATILTKMPKRLGSDDVRGVREIQEYFKIPDMLFKFHKEKYDETKDLTPWIRDTTDLIEKIDNHTSFKADATKSKFLGRILFLTKNYPPLKNRINKDIYTVLDAQYNNWEGKAKAGQRDKTKTTPIFSWDVIKSEVFKKYGKISYEALIIMLYDELIGRDDFNLNMAYKPDEMVNAKDNYFLLERKKKLSAIYMNNYKTVGRYGKLAFKLSKPITDLVMKLHPNDTAKTLFPMEKTKLSSFLIDLLKNIDLFKDEPGLGVKYLRHSLVSTKLMKLDNKDPDYTNKVVDLAEKAMHSVARQETYTSPLKNAKGKLINNESGEMYDIFDELTQEFDNLTQEEVRVGEKPELIGVEIKKKFGKKFYTGKVVAFDYPFYKVVYDDNDVEDFTEDDVKKYRVTNVAT